MIIYHVLFIPIVFFYTETLDYEVDAERFFRISKETQLKDWFNLFGTGSTFICFLILPLIKLLKSYFIITLIFSAISLLGFLNYIDLIYNYIKIERIKVFIVFLYFIPSLHFWTSFIGKEAITFTAMSYLLLYIVQDNKLKIASLLFLTLLIRPYVFFIIAISYFGYLFLKANKKNRIYFLITFSIILLIALPVLLKFLGVESYSLEGLNEAYNKVVVHSQNRGNSTIDLKESSFFYRVVLTLFLPFFIDIKTHLHLFSSIETLIVWGLIVKLTFSKISFKLQPITFYCLVCFLLFVVFYGLYLYNIGLASRMRIMFLPYLFYALFLLKNNYVISTNKNELP